MAAKPKRSSGGVCASLVTDENIEVAANCMAYGWAKFRIKRHLERLNKDLLKGNRKKGKMGTRTFETILTRARVRMLNAAQKPFEETFAESVRAYMRLLNDPDAEVRDKIRIVERLNSLFGHDAKFSNRDDDPEELAAAIRAAHKGMSDSVPRSEDGTDVE